MSNYTTNPGRNVRYDPPNLKLDFKFHQDKD